MKNLPPRNQVLFDEKKSVLLFNNKKIPVSKGKETTLCNVLFFVPHGTLINEYDISDKNNKSWDYQIAFHAFNPLNHKFEKKTGIKKFIKYKLGNIWVELTN